MIVDGPDRLWGEPLSAMGPRTMASGLTCVAVTVGFVCVAVIMDAWSRRIVGDAMSRRIDARLTLAALDAAIARRLTPPGCSTTATAGRKARPRHPETAFARRNSSARRAGAAIRTTTP